MGRILTLMILVASLCAAKPKVDLVWQRGTLIRIMPGESPHGGILGLNGGAASRLVFQTQDGLWLALLGPLQREPNVHVDKEYKFAVETVKCMVWDDCGKTTDQFGRVHEVKVKQVMHLVDEDGRETKLDRAQFKPGRGD